MLFGKNDVRYVGKIFGVPPRDEILGLHQDVFQLTTVQMG